MPLTYHALDYQQMFNLNQHDLAKNILDCSSLPNLFNAEWSAQGGKVISINRLFALPVNNLKQKLEEKGVSGSEIEKLQMDFSIGIKSGRYLIDTLPNLPFQHYQFDLALCADNCFNQQQTESEEAIIAAIKNLCDVAKEVRIFPLLNADGNIPQLFGPVTQALQKAAIGVEITAVPYQLHNKNNAMLKVWAQTCEI